ncbi:hypothetical protein LR48_Vigan08g025200 [Vigna angularis]|uniref:Secreted protein n=2 Tax=Phaseolus angularis TaxID=3914 RepID=A0A0L9V2V5_PHAAN|nr:hypothetical protein LR48_Vigan08g025200 [Vigna angularis]BAT89466.1 hypothetical protein VIGAN_06042200 [Vigna angularis var. angularis]
MVLVRCFSFLPSSLACNVVVAVARSDTTVEAQPMVVNGSVEYVLSWWAHGLLVFVVYEEVTLLLLRFTMDKLLSFSGAVASDDRSSCEALSFMDVVTNDNSWLVGSGPCPI